MLGPIDVVAITAIGYFYGFLVKEEKYRIARRSGHRLYLHLVVTGAPFYLTAWFLTKFLTTENIWRGAIPVFPLVDFAQTLLTIFLSLLFASLRVLISGDWAIEPTDAARNVWQTGDDIEVVTANAIQDEEPVAITLSNGSYYVGAISRTTEADDPNPYISIIPYMRGYTDNATGKIFVNYEYKDALERFDRLVFLSDRIERMYKLLPRLSESRRENWADDYYTELVKEAMENDYDSMQTQIAIPTSSIVTFGILNSEAHINLILNPDAAPGGTAQ